MALKSIMISEYTTDDENFNALIDKSNFSLRILKGFLSCKYFVIVQLITVIHMNFK